MIVKSGPESRQSAGELQDYKVRRGSHDAAFSPPGCDALPRKSMFPCSRFGKKNPQTERRLMPDPAGQPELCVLYEDNHCLAVCKPARMLTAGDRTGDVSLLELAREYLRVKYHKPGKVFVGLVHRLDRPVSGVVVFARTSKGAARLSEQFRERTIVKTYRALVEGRPEHRSGEFEDWLLKDEARNTTEIVAPQTPGARQGRLKYRVLQTVRGLSKLEIQLETGRSHQIRVQLAARGHPLCGDVKYGARRALAGAIALHAARLTFQHPTRREPITVVAADPVEWERFGFSPE
jgi:23S rRNA pseudouridine1911/1915/1917 synthase